MSATAWALTVIVSVLGGFATGVGGFGFGLVTTPVLLWVLPAPMVVVINLTTSVALRIPLLWADRTYVIGRQAFFIAVGGAVGMPIGIFVLLHFSDREIRLTAGLLIILLSTAQLLGAERLAPLPPLRGLAAFSVGATAGALNTSISLSGPPMVLWLLNQRIHGRHFRATISAASLVLNAAGVLILIRSGVAEVSWLMIPLVTYPAAGLGALLGHLALGRISATVFVRAAAMTVIGTSLLTVIFSL